MTQRRCSNPVCRREIFQCNGTTKAGDFMEAIEGTRAWDAVRELCPKCSTYMHLLGQRGGDQKTLHMTFGWA